MKILVRKTLKKPRSQLLLEERVKMSNPLEVRWPGQFSSKLLGRWWRVWINGKFNHVQYFAGYVSGNQQQAVERARKYWPEHIGNLELTPVGDAV